MEWQKFKKVDYLVKQTDQASSCVVFFHGYGADANDLASLSQVYKAEKSDWYFPQGVLEVPISPMMSGRAWFELRISDFEKVAGGTIVDVPLRNHDEKLLNDLSEWLNHLGKMYDRVVIGGFSQGAILTSHCFYRLNFSPAGLVLFSGFLMAPSAYPILPLEQKVPFYQSHGLQDPVLNVGGAQKLFEKLTDLGLRGRWKDFQGGHEIPMPVIADSQTFLDSVLKG